MRFASLLIAGLATACSSSPSSTPVASQLQWSVTTGTYGNGPLPCDSQQSGIYLDPGTSQLNVFCNQATGPNASTTVANITLAAFHGADTYTFQGSTDFSQSMLSFDLDNYSWTAVPASTGISATTCSVTIDAPAAPQRGDAVSGSFHCDAILGFVIEGDGGYHPQPAISVDGTFQGFDTL